METTNTFKKLDNMLINMPEKDGHHVLIRETVGWCSSNIRGVVHLPLL